MIGKSDVEKLTECLHYEMEGIFNNLESIKYALRDIRDLYKKELLHKGVIKNDK
jgi:hypothetical protein